MSKAPCLTLFLLVAACGASDDSAPGYAPDDKPGFTCAIGELTGTWRITYEEEGGGVCGPVPAETVSFDSAPTGGAGGACKYANSKISADKCRYDFDYTCPTTDGKGTQHWTGVNRQTAADELKGDSSVQVTHPDLGTCRSSYIVTFKKL